MKLNRYHKKRDFTKSPEPKGLKRKSSTKAISAKQTLSYVIQKHAARRLHYDFRLELDGVLVSWAVPKGPSFDPDQKRLAVHVEDHPLEYGKFEGSIPKGEYGGGEVIVWDNGSWIPVNDPHEGIKKGRLEFSLKGKKLKGSWVLVRMGPKEKEKENWLLIKRHDEFARPQAEYDVTTEKTKSVISKKTIEDIRKGSEKMSKTKRAA